MRSKPVVLAFSLFIETFVMAGSASAIPMVSLGVSDPDIVVGETFTLEVTATGVTDVDPVFGPDEIISFGFDVDYDHGAFAYNGATVSAPFFDDSLLFPGTDVAGDAFPGVSGNSISLASLSFTAVTAGTFSLGILSDLTDFNEGLGSYLYGPLDMTQSLDLRVNASPIPEPTALLLFGAGLAAWALFPPLGPRRGLT